MERTKEAGWHEIRITDPSSQEVHLPVDHFVSSANQRLPFIILPPPLPPIITPMRIKATNQLNNGVPSVSTIEQKFIKRTKKSIRRRWEINSAKKIVPPFIYSRSSTSENWTRSLWNWFSSLTLVTWKHRERFAWILFFIPIRFCDNCKLAEILCRRFLIAL